MDIQLGLLIDEAATIRQFNRMNDMTMTQILAGVTAFAVLGLAACTPTVKVAAPEKPITINLNVKIEHEIRVKVEKELDDVLSEESGLF